MHLCDCEESPQQLKRGEVATPAYSLDDVVRDVGGCCEEVERTIIHNADLLKRGQPPACCLDEVDVADSWPAQRSAPAARRNMITGDLGEVPTPLPGWGSQRAAIPEEGENWYYQEQAGFPEPLPILEEPAAAFGGGGGYGREAAARHPQRLPGSEQVQAKALGLGLDMPVMAEPPEAAPDPSARSWVSAPYPTPREGQPPPETDKTAQMQKRAARSSCCLCRLCAPRGGSRQEEKKASEGASAEALEAAEGGGAAGGGGGTILGEAVTAPAKVSDPLRTEIERQREEQQQQESTSKGPRLTEDPMRTQRRESTSRCSAKYCWACCCSCCSFKCVSPGLSEPEVFERLWWLCFCCCAGTGCSRFCSPPAAICSCCPCACSVESVGCCGPRGPCSCQQICCCLTSYCLSPPPLGCKACGCGCRRHTLPEEAQCQCCCLGCVAPDDAFFACLDSSMKCLCLACACHVCRPSGPSVGVCSSFARCGCCYALCAVPQRAELSPGCACCGWRQRTAQYAPRQVEMQGP